MTNIFNAYHVVQIEPGLWRVNEETFDVYERARSYAAFMNEETPIDYAARIAELEAQLAEERTARSELAAKLDEIFGIASVADPYDADLAFPDFRAITAIAKSAGV